MRMKKLFTIIINLSYQKSIQFLIKSQIRFKNMQEQFIFENRESFNQAIYNQVLQVLVKNSIVKKIIADMINTKLLVSKEPSHSKQEAKQEKIVKVREKIKNTIEEERQVTYIEGSYGKNQGEQATQIIQACEEKLLVQQVEIHKQNDRIEALENKLKWVQKQVNKFNIDELIHLKKHQKQPLIDYQSAMLNKFKINEQESEFEVKQFQGRNYQLLGTRSVREHQFSCCILKTHSKSIGIGVIDSQHIGDTNSIWDMRTNCICMRLANGSIYEGGKEKDKKEINIKAGENVKVFLKESTIYWKINEKTYEYTSTVFKDPKIKWVGFFMMGHKGDKVRIS